MMPHHPREYVQLRLGDLVVARLSPEHAAKVAQAVVQPGVLVCSPVTGLDVAPSRHPVTGAPVPGRARIVLVIEVPFE